MAGPLCLTGGEAEGQRRQSLAQGALQEGREKRQDVPSALPGSRAGLFPTRAGTALKGSGTGVTVPSLALWTKHPPPTFLSSAPGPLSLSSLPFPTGRSAQANRPHSTQLKKKLSQFKLVPFRDSRREEPCADFSAYLLALCPWAATRLPRR